MRKIDRPKDIVIEGHVFKVAGDGKKYINFISATTEVKLRVSYPEQKCTALIPYGDKTYISVRSLTPESAFLTLKSQVPIYLARVCETLLKQFEPVEAGK